MPIIARTLLVLSCCAVSAAYALAAPATLEAPAAVAAESSAAEEIAISVSQGKVRVVNAEGATLEVYDITGVKVMSVRLDSNDKTVPLNLNRGIYILKVGKVARRVNLL